MIGIVFCFDSNLQNYINHAVNSILANTKSDIHFHFIVDDSVKDEGEYIIKGSQGTVYYYDRHNIPEIKIADCGFVRSRMSFARWFIPEIIQSHNNRVIYLDNDVLLNADIKEFYDIDLVDKTIGMVPDYFHKFVKGTLFFQGNIPERYHNNRAFLTGQMLIDIDRWKHYKFTEKLMAFQKETSALIMACMNSVCQDEIKELPKEWCAPCNRLDENGICQVGLHEGVDFSEAKLFHASGKLKWWDSKIFANELYEKYK